MDRKTLAALAGPPRRCAGASYDRAGPGGLQLEWLLMGAAAMLWWPRSETKLQVRHWLADLGTWVPGSDGRGVCGPHTLTLLLASGVVVRTTDAGAARALLHALLQGSLESYASGVITLRWKHLPARREGSVRLELTSEDRP